MELDEKSRRLVHPADFVDSEPIPPWEALAALTDPKKRKNLNKTLPFPPGHSKVCVRINPDGSFTYETLDYQKALERKAGYYRQGDT
jgi:hypothetical protein